MSLSLYMDHHVPSSVTDGLRIRGVDVLTAFDDEHSDADDDVILARATELARVVYSQDRDLLRIKASEPQDMRNRIEFIPLH